MLINSTETACRKYFNSLLGPLTAYSVSWLLRLFCCRQYDLDILHMSIVAKQVSLL